MPTLVLLTYSTEKRRLMRYSVPIPGRGRPQRLYSVGLDIACEDARLLPIETPGVFHGDNGVGAGNHSPQYERAIEVTLVPPEQFKMRFRVFRHERDHNAGHRFVLFLNGTLNADYPRRKRSCQLKCGARGDVNVVTWKF